MRDSARPFKSQSDTAFKPFATLLTVVCGLALASCGDSGQANPNSATGDAKSTTAAPTPHLSPIIRPRAVPIVLAAIAPPAPAATAALASPNNVALAASVSADVDGGQSPLTVHFDASKSVGPANLPLTFEWDFGDQSAAVGATVQHAFSNSGTYNVVVVVSDGQASVTSAPMTITVTPAPAARNSSTLFYVSPAVSAGQTVLLHGTGLGGVAQAAVAQVTDTATPDPTKASFSFPAATDLSSSTVVPILQSSTTAAKITVPAFLAPGVYALQYQPPAGNTAPNPSTLIHAVVNLPWIQWWMGRSTLPGSTGGAAYAGQEIDVFGRNFGLTPKVWVSVNGAFTPLTVLQSNPYRVSATIPGSLPAGTYQLWVHNGHGGQYGFSDPTSVAVAAPPAPWPATQFNVTQFGAKGNGTADDTAAIAAALQAAAVTGQNGGVVYLPPGRYLVSAKLRVPANTIVAGAGASSTTIMTANLPVSNGRIPSLFEGSAHFIIQDLTLNSGAADFLITCPASQGMYDFYGIHQPLGANCVDVTLQRLSVIHTTLQAAQSNGQWRGGRTLNLQGSDLRILDSVVSSQNNATLFLSEPTNSTIIGNTFLDGAKSYLMTVNSATTIIEGNDISATDPTGNCVNNQGQVHHIYVAENNIHDCQGTYGEAFTLDTPYYPYWLGHLVTMGGSTGPMTFPNPINGPNYNLTTDGGTNLAGRYIAVIVGGTGLGEMNPISSNTATSISFESPWKIPLDSSSVIDIQLDKSQNVFYQNRFSNASVGVQLYSEAYANVVDGSIGVNMGGSYCVGNDIAGQSVIGGPLVREFEYCYYNEWLNNGFDGNLPDSNINRANQLSYPNAFIGQAGNATNFTGLAASIMPRDPLVMFLGNAIRGSILNDNNTIGYAFRGPHVQTPPPSLDEHLSIDLIIEKNQITNCQYTEGSSNDSPVGIDVYPGAFNSLVTGNSISGCQLSIWNSSQLLN